MSRTSPHGPRWQAP